VGKPLGITLFSWIAVKLGVGKMPKHASWMHIVGVGMLGGIGFTMSIFIALLSFSGKELILSEAKFSILTASIISGVIGYFWLGQVEKKTDKIKPVLPKID
jgi:NhaA family Na+:H+ antiporter